MRIAIALLGFDGEVKIEPADTADVNDSVRQTKSAGQNSRGNCRGRYHLLRLARDPRLSRRSRRRRQDRAAQPKERLAALRLQALCDGILDASILTIYETRWRKAETHEPKWLEHQAGKVTRALAALEAAPPVLNADLPNVGQITLACVLGYRDFRFGTGWRGGHPRLVAWLDDFAARVPAFAATKPTG